MHMALSLDDHYVLQTKRIENDTEYTLKALEAAASRWRWFMGMLNIYGTEREKNCGALEGAIHKTEQDAFSEGELFISHVSRTSLSRSDQ